MDIVLRYRGRTVTHRDVVFIRDLIVQHPTKSRRALSKELCLAWDWRQENGALKDMVCRGLMLALHRAGAIELPPAHMRPRNPLAGARRRPPPVLVDRTPLTVGLGDLQPLEFCSARRTAAEGIVDGLLEEHHYLGYTHPVGEQFKYLVLARGRPVACFAWSSAPRHLGPRDRFIGWSREARKQNIRFLAYNTRFLVLPWVEVPHLASHLLGRMARRLSRDWEALYGHPIHYLESFVDPERFRGTCYRAANWHFLGKTTGRGKDDHSNRVNRSLKEALGLPLTRRFREILGTVR
ncbi:MAG: Druantia anti-phage system protein DruA [Planctomycetota bacterium]